MKLKKDSHLFIPFDESGKNLVGSYGSPYIYQSIKTAMKYAGKNAAEIVEYAPIISCRRCKYYIAAEGYLEGYCVYNRLPVYADEFCSRGVFEKHCNNCRYFDKPYCVGYPPYKPRMVEAHDVCEDWKGKEEE